MSLTSKLRRRYTCQYNCGWYREWHDQEDWLSELIDHPEYGIVTEREVVDRDITNHHCLEYKQAQRESPRQKARRNGDVVWEYLRSESLPGRPSQKAA